MRSRALWSNGWLLPLVLAFLLVGCPGQAGTSISPPAQTQADAQPQSPVTAAPTATATAAATATAGASSSAIATPLAKAPPGVLPVSGDRAYQHVKELAEKIGSRPTGSDKEREAASYITAQLQGYGYRVERQGFDFQTFQVKEAKAAVVEPTPQDLSVRALYLSGSGEARAPLVFVGLGQASDLPAEGLGGKVALIERGTIEFREKVANVAAAGAKGAIVYNNRPGPFRGALRQVSAIPAVSLSQEDGQRLRGLLEQGPVQVHLRVNAALTTITSQNVIGRGDTTCRIVIGGHYDSVAEGPGANDNASGTAVVLEVARTTRTVAASWGICFVAFGGEELGLHGSRHYVSGLSPEEEKGMVGMINLDMVGVGNAWKLEGSEDLIKEALRATKDVGVASEEFNLPSGTGSDHASFMAAGVPAVFLHRTEDPNYHTAGDTANQVSARALEEAGKAAIAILQDVLGPRVPATP